MKQWLLKKDQLSHMNLLKELKQHPNDCKNFLRMDGEAFKLLLLLEHATLWFWKSDDNCRPLKVASA
nr:unnamed protein product [Callosobruchus analis]